MQSTKRDTAKYLASTRLKDVMPSYGLPPTDLNVYSPSRRNEPAKLRAFIDFLASEFKT